MKVQILQCSHNGFAPLAWLIKLFQRTNYSHYAIGFTSSTGEYLILDATSKNVALRSSVHFLKHYEIMEETTIRIEYPVEDFMAWYEPLLGERYGYLQLIGIVLKTRKLGEGIICNELVLRFLRRFFGLWDDYIDTRDLNYTSWVVEQIASNQDK